MSKPRIFAAFAASVLAVTGVGAVSTLEAQAATPCYGSLCLYQSNNLNGWKIDTGYTCGVTPVMPSGTNDDVSSVKSQTTYQKILYQHGNFDGATFTIIGEWQGNLDNHGWDNIISSYKWWG